MAANPEAGAAWAEWCWAVREWSELWVVGEGGLPAMANTEAMAPIVWRRHRSGMPELSMEMPLSPCTACGGVVCGVCCVVVRACE